MFIHGKRRPSCCLLRLKLCCRDQISSSIRGETSACFPLADIFCHLSLCCLSWVLVFLCSPYEPGVMQRFRRHDLMLFGGFAALHFNSDVQILHGKTPIDSKSFYKVCQKCGLFIIAANTPEGGASFQSVSVAKV